MTHKNFRHHRLLSLLISMVLISLSTGAQTLYTLEKGPVSTVKILGTSNLHDWTMQAHSGDCKAEFSLSGSGQAQLKGLKSLSFTLPVQTLKSGESMMDSKAYHALKSDKFGTISFDLSAASVTPAKNGQYTVTANGKLCIAGVCRIVQLDVACTVNADGSITCSGSEKLKMTDYQVDPPTFMFGALKTADDITIAFTLFLTADSNKSLSQN